jgi:flagellar hook assembly protein FlgD
MDPIGRIDQGLIDRSVLDTTKSGTSGSDFDGDMFLQLLLTQLQNQDPFNTVETGEIMQQQAILSQVEQGLKQTEALDSVQATVDIGLSDIAATLANINNTLTTLLKNQGGNSGGES